MSGIQSTNNARRSTRKLIARLLAIKSRFSKSDGIEKRSILQAVDGVVIRDPHLLIKLHKTLCFLKAFPDSSEVLRLACEILGSFRDRIRAVPRARRSSLEDSGIIGTSVCHEYSYSQAQWLATNYPDNADICWALYENSEKLDDLLSYIITPAEEDIFQSGEISTKDWVKLARGKLASTDLNWLLSQLGRQAHLDRFWRELYDAAELPIRWKLDGARASITRNALDRDRIAYRSGGMRRPNGSLASIIRRATRRIRLLGTGEGTQLIDAAMAALAIRQRDVYSMAHANPREVFLAPLGQGAEVAVYGVLPAFRPVLEGNFGYLLLSNGVPIGYGGVSPLFHQANTGVNVFEEYRSSEAAYLFSQTLRVFHTLFASRRFIVSPYQFGQENSEAIRSGAFWFYYRLGFRPVDKEADSLAHKEWLRLKRRRGAKSDPKLLRTISRSTMVYQLPGFKESEGFPETWLTTCSRGTTRLMADQACPSRAVALRRIARNLRATLGVRSRNSWAKDEREAFDRMAPLVSLCDLDEWSRNERKDLVSLMRSQGGRSSKSYILRLRSHKKLLAALRDYCATNA